MFSRVFSGTVLCLSGWALCLFCNSFKTRKLTFDWLDLAPNTAQIFMTRGKWKEACLFDQWHIRKSDEGRPTHYCQANESHHKVGLKGATSNNIKGWRMHVQRGIATKAEIIHNALLLSFSLSTYKYINIHMYICINVCVFVCMCHCGEYNCNRRLLCIILSSPVDVFFCLYLKVLKLCFTTDWGNCILF